MVIRSIMIGTLALIAQLPGSARAEEPGCAGLLPSPSYQKGDELITASDLVRMRDVGLPDIISGAASPYALSPDGHTLAFVLARGDPSTNTVCSALVTVPVKGEAAAQIVDRGGALPLSRGELRGVLIATGFPEQLTPAWSPDGASVAWRKRVNGTVQLVIARSDGSGARILTRSPTDIDSFIWSADGHLIIYGTRASEADAEGRIGREGRSGWLYDARIVPNMSWRPKPWVRDIPPQKFIVEIANGKTRAATPDDRSRLALPEAAAGGIVADTDGAKAWTVPISAHPEAERRILVSDPQGRTSACSLASCSGRIVRLVWNSQDRSLLFLRREGWNGEETAIYRWKPGSARLSLVLRTRDSLTGCIAGPHELICGRENALTPRRVVAIDLSSGSQRLLFDPNPEFSRFRLGTVERLRWKNDRDLPAWGDLVLPPGYKGKERLPLIVVLYHSRGFLRGGTGDEYPVYPLAARGFAVLSIERPPGVSGLVRGLRDWDEVRAASLEDWAERRSMHSTVMIGIDKAIATGAVDPARIGITGLSDGASTVEFALVNSDRFAAASISTCCDDMLSSLVLGGVGWADENRSYGFPPSYNLDRSFWKPISLSVNAPHITTPLLMQLADREASLALPSYGALREAGAAVEMHVFPDEYHIKRQPEHKLAIYDRNIDWFDFWLRNREDSAPEKADRFKRWMALRDFREKERDLSD